MSVLPLRFALPASLGPERAARQVSTLGQWLAEVLPQQPIEVVAVEGYAAIGRELLSGRCQIGWLPPMVAARVELNGGMALARAVRQQASSYRAALICHRDRPVDPERLVDLHAAWTDRDSLAGYLLPRAWVRGKGVDPDQAFAQERFLGSFRAALEEVLAGRAQLTSVFAPVASAGKSLLALEELPQDSREQLLVTAFTQEAPNDALMAAASLSPQLRELLSGRLLQASQEPPARAVLEEVFGAEALAASPEGAFRSLYGIVLAASGLTASPLACAACGANLSLQARFCDRCGEPTLRGERPATRPPPPPPKPVGAAARWSEERKLATVLFADLSGFTEISSRLEPDAVQEFANACFEPLTQEIERRGGTVIKYIGDCVMAAFGVPVGTEADARHAVQAALAMTARLAEQSEAIQKRHGAPISVRIGINTGLVMVGAVGSGGGGALDIMGSSVNLASRVQTAASPGQVVLGPSTQRLVQGAFELEALPPAHLKGLPEPVPLFRAIRERSEEHGSTSGLDAPYKLRERELKALVSAYGRTAQQKRTEVVLLLGDAGLGKARLLRELREKLAEDPRMPEVLATGAALGPTSSLSSPLLLIGRLLRVRFGVKPHEPVAEARARLVEGVVEAFSREEAQDGREAAQLLADLCGLRPAEAPLPGMQSGELKDRIFRAFADWIDRLARHRPVCLVLQNLQWADDASLDFLERLVQGGAQRPVLVVAGARSELEDRRPGWPSGAEHKERVVLTALPAERMRRFVDFLLAEAPGVPATLKEELVARSEGNPECARDFVRLLVDRGAIVVCKDGPWQWRAEQAGEIALPETVQGVLQARLDALPPPEKEALRRASVVGRTFWKGAIEALTPERDRAGIDALLTSLEARGLIRPRHPSLLQGQPQFAFRTVALRDICYRSWPRKGRESAHRKVAGWLDAQGQVWGDGSAEIATHYEAGGAPEQARPHLVEAARHAAGIYAHKEAVDFYQRALRRWPDAVERAGRAEVRQELATMFTHMSRYEEALAQFDQASQDATDAGGPPSSERLAWIESQRAVALKESGRMDEALSALDRGLALLEGKAVLARIVLLGQRAFIRAARGNSAGAGADCSEGLALAPGISERGEAWHVAVIRLNNSLGALHMHAGRPDEAEACFKVALELTRSTRDPRPRFGLAVNLGAIAYDRHEFSKATSYFEQALVEARKSQRKSMIAVCLSNLGQSRLGAGELKAAISLLEEARTMAMQAGMPDVHADSARSLAEALLATGEPAAALVKAEEAIALAKAAGIRRQQAMAHATAMDCLLAKAAPGPEGQAVAAAHLQAATELLQSGSRAGREAEVDALRERFRRVFPQGGTGQG